MNPLLQTGLMLLLSLASISLALAGIGAPFQFRDLTLPLLRWTLFFIGLAILWAGFVLLFVEGRVFGVGV